MRVSPPSPYEMITCQLYRDFSGLGKTIPLQIVAYIPSWLVVRK